MKIINVKPMKDYNLIVSFDDGRIIKYDVKPLLESKVFSPLKDMMFFKLVKPTWCGIEWTDDIDICADSIINDGIRVSKNEVELSNIECTECLNL